MADRVEQVRQQLSQGVSRVQLKQQLINEGFQQSVAEQIVREAEQQAGQSGGSGGGGGSGGSSADIQVPTSLVFGVLFVVLAGVAVVLFVPDLLGGESGETTDGDTTDTGDMDAAADDTDETGEAPEFAEFTSKDGTYQLSYTVDEGETDTIETFIVFNTPEWQRKLLATETGAGVEETSQHRHREKELIVYCGQTMKSVTGAALDDEPMGNCTHSSLQAIFFPMLVTSARPFADNMDDINATFQEQDEIAGRSCSTFTVEFALSHLYDDLAAGALDGESTANSTETVPGEAEICFDDELGYAAQVTYTAQEQDTNQTAFSTSDMTYTVTDVQTDVPPEAAAPESEAVLNVACPDTTGGDPGTATMTALDDTDTATLRVNGENQTVDVTPMETKTLELQQDDLQDGQNIFTFFTDTGADSDFCYM